MEEEKKTQQEQPLNDKQREYLASFKEAMRAIDEKVKADIKDDFRPPKAYISLIRDGLWRPDIIGFQFMLCTRGLCGLPRRQRDYIIAVGGVAKKIFDKAHEPKESTEEQS